MTKIDVRDLTSEGETHARRVLMEPTASSITELHRSVLAGVPGKVDPALSKPIPGSPQIEYRWFSTWEEAGAHFTSFFAAHPSLDRPAVWSWLGLNWLALGKAEGRKFAVGGSERWLLEHSWNRRYRHLLWSPCHIYRLHGPSGRAAALLAQPFTVPGEVVGNIASRQFLLTSDAVMDTVTKLYYDPARKTLKPGAASEGSGFGSQVRDGHAAVRPNLRPRLRDVDRTAGAAPEGVRRIQAMIRARLIDSRPS